MFGLTKPSSIQKQFAAVHLITESGDHYNLLVEHVTAYDIVNYIRSEMGDEFDYVCDWFITAEDPSISDAATKIISEALEDL